MKVSLQMFPIESFRNTLVKFVAILREHKIPFHLTGGVTSATYGEPRFTQDIDIVVENNSIGRRLNSLISALRKSDFIFDEKSLNSAVENQKMFQLFDPAESLKLDIYPRELIPGELGRSVDVELFPNLFLPIVSRVDAAASKLIWIAKGSHKSRRDFRQLILGASTDERHQVLHFAKQENLEDVMKSVLSESDEIE